MLKNPWNLTELGKTKLTELPKTNATLYHAYLLKESFAEILDLGQTSTVRAKLTEWISWATRTGIKPFASVAKTITKHLDGIVACAVAGLSNAAFDGTNVRSAPSLCGRSDSMTPRRSSP